MNTRTTPRKLALDLLGRSPCSVQVAAVLSDSRGIFAWGWNHAIQINGNRGEVIGVHAEQHAIKRANPKRLRGARLTVTGRRENDHFVYAKPCAAICLPLCIKYGIGTIEFTDRDGSWIILCLQYA